MSRYDDILARLRAATGPDRLLDRDVGLGIGGWEAKTDRWGSAIYANGDRHVDAPGGTYPSPTESLEDALALVEKTLLGWNIRLGIYSRKDGSRYASAEVSLTEAIIHPNPAKCGVRTLKAFGGNSSTAPLAILTALFEALKAQEADHG